MTDYRTTPKPDLLQRVMFRVLAGGFLLWFLIFAGALAACASPVAQGPLMGTCLVQPVGQSDNGTLAVRYRCEPE